ncbi:family 10 glycosylhydrolase [Roseofilum reptotaenium CS-1145]|uniref:Glycosyl hydrolase-like 10 domain-containing protein n=1 Tax=Roseofilum reptotaenium AO1-A TaxID=1925591 RepID=A0A1L9QQA9_9CYAN|nr:family 10 glycosylhydrolase [Roseofilum reptotaenium]MDB9520061.1 family 10 glycosylhydrolase [Roseofilum reptotaenium CS-1145]OJJ24829.1 hypothetical protein BI308_14790 [Roseofilum reptotaenium AO1-A]
MSKSQEKPKGCEYSSIPLSVIILCLGLGYGLFTQRHRLPLDQLLPHIKTAIAALNLPIGETTPEPSISPSSLPSSPSTTPSSEPSLKPSPTAKKPTPDPSIRPSLTPEEVVASPSPSSVPKSDRIIAIRGIYLSRYLATANASEKTIRDRVRYYKKQGINTIIHGVWGNGCTMYKSEVMEKKLGYESCPNQFPDQWLDWLIDEAHKQGMEVHAYFEKGIKIDENSPIFDLAIDQRWIVAGVDKTHTGIDHYVLDVAVPKVASLLTDVLVEFVEKYPEIDAVQWDDYLGYHAELPGKSDHTQKLTDFVQNMIAQMKEANPNVSFDICHHNPYWAKTYFDADWENWDVDRVFIQVYNMDNFQDEMKYVAANDGIAITERQFDYLPQLVNNPEIDSILLFPLEKPDKMAATYHQLIAENGE